jgi:miniconductance mechanosensitive channel
MINRFREIDLIREYIETELARLETWNREHNVNPRSPANRRQLTNLDAFREYVCAYLKSRPDLHQDEMTLLARQLEPGPAGLPIEVYAFTKSVNWTEYEDTQAEIFGHLVASIPEFGLRVFQEPAGMDFQALLRPQRRVAQP